MEIATTAITPPSLVDIAEDLVACIAEWLTPNVNTGDVQLANKYADASLGAAHWVQLSKSLASAMPVAAWSQKLIAYRRNHRETKECCRVLEALHEERDDWPLQVLRLRGARCGCAIVSHPTPISRHTLRSAYAAATRIKEPAPSYRADPAWWRRQLLGCGEGRASRPSSSPAGDAGDVGSQRGE